MRFIPFQWLKERQSVNHCQAGRGVLQSFQKHS